LWDSLEAKYMAEDASSKKFLDNDKPKGYNVVGPSFVNMIDHNNSIGYNDNRGKRKHQDTKLDPNKKSKDEALDKFKVFKTEVELEQGSLIKRFIGEVRLSQGFWDEAMVVVKLPDPKLKTLSERGIECILVGYAKHSKAFRFYVIEAKELVSINLIIKSKDAIFDENKFSSVHRPSQRSLINRTEDIGGLVVTKEVVVQQHEPELRKSKRNRTLKNFGLEFQLYLIEGIRDEVSDQHSYCFNVEDDPKIFDKAMKSHDVAFWKEAINDEMDSIMGNNTWVLTDLPLGCKPLSFKLIFKIKLKVDGTIENFKARLVIHGFRQKSRIYYIDTYAPVARINTIRLLIALASIDNLIIHQMDMKITFLNGKLDEEATVERLIEENQAPGMVNDEFGGTMEKDIEDMTIDEDMKYEAEIKRQSWRDVRSYFPTKYDDGDDGSFHLDKNRTLDYPYYVDDAKIDAYYKLPPLLPYEESVMSEQDTSDNTDAPNLEPHDEGMSNDDDVDEWKTNMLVGMANMTQQVPLGTVENVLIKMDKFVFPCDFVVIDMPGVLGEMMILGRPFLATIHAQINVFNGEISFGRVKFDVNENSHHSNVTLKKFTWQLPVRRKNPLISSK
ncbi:zinc finger, CCHC-type containing protein, partial [Tanacetum coccineum]